jgi:hypothetical protein
VLYKILVIGIILLLIVMSITPSIAVNTINIEHANGKSSGENVDWWPMFRHDLQHSGFSTSDAPDTNNVLWNYTTDGDVESSPAVADGKVYIGSRDWKVYCLDADTGDFIWSYETGGNVDSSPAVADGRVYIGSRDEKVYCLDADTGDFIWSYKTGGGVWSSPAVADGMVYIGSCDRIVYVFGELDSDAPSAPEVNGPIRGARGILYNFTFKAESPVDNNLFYWIEWADGSNSGWLGPFDSGVEITESHVWDVKGTCRIQAKAKDINGLVSSWSIFRFRISRNRTIVNSLFQLFFERFPLLEVIILRAMNLLR